MASNLTAGAGAAEAGSESGERARRKPRHRSKPKLKPEDLGLGETGNVHDAASTFAGVEYPGLVMTGLDGRKTNTSSATNTTSGTSTPSNNPPVPSSSASPERGPNDAGPSHLPHSLASRLSHPLPPDADTNKTTNASSSTDSTGPGAASTSMGFTTGADFIPFDFSDEEVAEEAAEEDGELMLPVPSPGKGKGRDRPELDVDVREGQKQNGLKRSAEMMEEDGYANKKQRTDASSRLTPWARDVDWDNCRNLAELLHQEVAAFVRYISPTPEEHEVRGMVITIISRAIQSTWPDARISPFGSYETKLYLPLGDIDLVVESRMMENYEKRQVLHKLAQVLRKENITDNVQVIAKAKVPIVKFVTSHGRFAVDISLNQGNGVKAGRIVNRLLKQLPALQSLVMVIKLFLSQRSLNEVYTGGLGSYAIVCMAVSFLQMHPKIRAGEINPSENLGVLVMEFFELYGHYFNYENTGISLRHGGTYFNKLARGWSDFRRPSLLSIEDPLDSSNDISKSSFNMTRIRKIMAGAHEVLAAVALTRSRILMSKARGQYTDLRGSYGKAREDDDQSILGSVMGVTQETLNHRRMVKQLYEQSTLHNLLGLPRSRPPETTAPRGPSGISHTPPRHQSRRAVELAWGEADMEVEETEEDLLPRLNAPDAEEESRYSTRYPRKRRRVDSPKTNGTRADAVFVEASEEDEQFVPEIAPHSSSSRISREGSVHLRDARDGRAEARRAYWASKGMSGGGLEESD